MRALRWALLVGAELWAITGAELAHDGRLADGALCAALAVGWAVAFVWTWGRP